MIIRFDQTYSSNVDYTEYQNIKQGYKGEDYFEFNSKNGNQKV